jgi:hypothetical protein
MIANNHDDWFVKRIYDLPLEETEPVLKVMIKTNTTIKLNEAIAKHHRKRY